MRLLAATNLKLEAELEAPATAGVAAGHGGARRGWCLCRYAQAYGRQPAAAANATWWACLAGRDVLGAGAEPTPALCGGGGLGLPPRRRDPKRRLPRRRRRPTLWMTPPCARQSPSMPAARSVRASLKEYPAPDGAHGGHGALAWQRQGYRRAIGGDLHRQMPHYMLDRASRYRARRQWQGGIGPPGGGTAT